ncbi:uncharacterized protein LOC144727755 isoform X3 [Lampetra planeri]
MEEEEAEATPALVAHGAAGGWARLALLYGAVSAVFCVAVGHRLLRARLRPGVRAACSLLLLFMGEPLCAAFAPGAPGLLAFALACLLSYATLPFTASLPAAGRAVLIVGCESAASHVLARRLAELGCRVFVGVRASSHAEAGRIAGDLAPDPSGDPASGRPGPVHVLGLKPGDPRSVTAAEKEVRSLVGADGEGPVFSRHLCFFAALLDSLFASRSPAPIAHPHGQTRDALSSTATQRAFPRHRVGLLMLMFFQGVEWSAHWAPGMAAETLGTLLQSQLDNWVHATVDRQVIYGGIKCGCLASLPRFLSSMEE